MVDIGDRVIITSKGYIGNRNVRSTDKGVVVDIEERCGMYSICVEIDRFIDGHDASGLGKDGHCVWVSPKSVLPDRRYKNE